MSGKKESEQECRPDATPAVGLFATPSGIRAVQSPARAKILSVLAEHELPFDEIVRQSGKAKSTVSVQLQGLEHEGIIIGRRNPEDSRKKLFSISSPLVGNLAGVRPDLKETPEGLARLVAGPDPFRFYRLMFRTIRVSLLSEGINIDPVLRNAGYEVGERIYSALAAPDLEEILERTTKFWTKNNLGTLEVESTGPLVMRVYDCFECGSLPELGRPACAFDSGILQAIFTRHYRKPQQVDETACYAMGDDHCRFVIAPGTPGIAPSA